MSLKHPYIYESRRCRGSATSPSEIIRDITGWNGKPIRHGRCGVCARIFDVTKAGRLRPHMDYEAERRTRP